MEQQNTPQIQTPIPPNQNEQSLDVSRKRGFFLGWVWIVFSIFGMIGYLSYIFNPSIDLVLKLALILIEILSAITIYGVIIKKKWAFYFLLPSMILGLVPILLIFQGMFNFFNSVLNWSGNTHSVGLSLGVVAIPLTIVFIIWLVFGILWVVYFAKRFVGNLSKILMVSVIILSLLIAVGILFYYQQKYPNTNAVKIQQPVQQVPQQQNNAPVTQVSDWQTYTNSQYGFSLSYPTDFANVNNLTSTQKNSLMSYMGACPVGNNALALNETSFCYIGNQTSDGFAVASLNITASTTTSMQDCEKSKPNGPDGELTPTHQTTVNGIIFYEAQFSDAGLGHFVSTDSYGSYHGGTCYTVDLNIESNRGTSEKGLSADFSSMMHSKLVSILSTFNFTNQATSQTQNTPTAVTSPKTTNVPVNTKPSNFTCLNIKNVTYAPQLLSGQTLFVEWGSQYTDTKTWGSYGSIDSSGSWSGFATSTGTFRQGTNSSLMPLTILPLQSNTQSTFQKGIMTITCSDGKTVNAHIPVFKSGFGAQYEDLSNNKFYLFYVANDGSTYYDAALTKLALSALN